VVVTGYGPAGCTHRGCRNLLIVKEHEYLFDIMGQMVGGVKRKVRQVGPCLRANCQPGFRNQRNQGSRLVKPCFAGKWREASEGAGDILSAKLAYFGYAV
jgi:hypothetical protein